MVNISELFKRTRYRRTLLTILGLIIWAIGVSIMVTLFFKEIVPDIDNDNEFAPYIESKGKVLGLSVEIQSFKPDIKEADIKIESFAFPGIISDLKVVENFDLTIDSITKKFKVNEIAAPFTRKIRIDEGALRMFPFDNYHGELNITANIPAKKDKEKQIITIMAIITGNVRLFDLTKNTRAKFSMDGHIAIPLVIVRPKTTIIISVSMTLLMWALAIAVMNLAIDYVIYSRETPPNFLLIGVSVMFSLPALRESQPGIPVMGCLVDLLGFFWSLSIVATSTCAILFLYVFSWKPNHFKKIDTF